MLGYTIPGYCLLHALPYTQYLYAIKLGFIIYFRDLNNETEVLKFAVVWYVHTYKAAYFHDLI